MTDVFQPGTIKPEADYLELERLSRKLGIPVPMMHIELQATNPDGSIGDHYKDRSRTYNRNFYNLAFTTNSGVAVSSGVFGAGVLSVKDTAATTATIKGASASAAATTGTPQFCLNSVVSNATVGVIVGTGTTAESFEHTTLVTPVAQGTGAGQMSYAQTVFPTPSYNAGSKTWTSLYTRILNNNSGGTIVVAETGLYGVFVDSAGTVHIAMVERSLLGATVSVLNAGQLTVTYTITMTFPA